MTIALYTGRFQPFHNGHFEALKYIMSKAEETFVLICSKKGISPLDDRNPFEYEERKKMIELSLGLPPKVHFRHIKDQENDQEWVRVIENEIPKGRIVSFSNNPNTIKAFRAHGYESLPIPIKYDNLNATSVRKRIIRNEQWSNLVPMGTKTVIDMVRDK